MSSTFSVWLLTAWTNLLSWFGVEEQKLASFLYPLFQDAKTLIKNDLLTDVINGIPVVTAALAGGVPAALVAAEEYILPILEKQGLTLLQTTINQLANGLVAQAQAGLDKAGETVA